MNLMISSILIITDLVGLLQEVSALRCRRSMRTCRVNDTSTGGEPTLEEYNGCTHLCCGAAIHQREEQLECCGDELMGDTYNPSTHFCCSWPYGREFAVHEKTDFASGSFCCGTDVIEPDKDTAHQSCCNGYLNRPEVFNHLTEMCCAGNRGFAGDTAYTSCCGDTSYDRRVASCPCQNGEIGVGIPDAEAGCCYSNNRSFASTYNVFSEGCCNGQSYDIATQFCCGDEIGDKESQICCERTITATSSQFDREEMACCVVGEGESTVYQAYDPSSSVCCQGSVMPKNAEGGAMICCGDRLYEVDETINACCGNEPYFAHSSSVCCKNIVQHTRNFTNASCCGNQTFDAYLKTCCGATIFENPPVFNERGGLEPSHHTRCCGDHSDDSTLVPYDYQTQACCGGVVVELGLTPFDMIECCGIGIIEVSSQICCNSMIVDNDFGANGACCNDIVINKTDTICCQGSSHSIVGIDNASCCGSTLMNPSEQICCNGEPRTLDGVSAENAICCGDGCIDGSSYWCCDGKQFQKGATNGEAVSGLSCSDLFV